MSFCGNRKDVPGGPVACDPCKCADILREELGIEKPPRISVARSIPAVILARWGRGRG